MGSSPTTSVTSVESARVDAATALEWGLVNRVVPRHELDDATMSLADEIARNEPFVVRTMKASINRVWQLAGLRAALDAAWNGAEAVVVAGPTPISYAGFVRSVASAAGQRRPRIVMLPPPLLRLATVLTLLPGLPRVRGAEVRRLMEDKAFDTGEMRRRLGVVPISLVRGLAETFTQTL